MAGQGEGRSLEETPTWAISVFCLLILIVSSLIEGGLHHLAEFLKRRRRKSLRKALDKIKIEMMQMGFISLLLTVSEVPLSRICVSEAVASSFRPCKHPVEMLEPAVSSTAQVLGLTTSNATLSSTDYEEDSFCKAKGLVSLISSQGIMQLHLFIPVLAVCHILYCVVTMCLGNARMAKWNAWEEETRTLEYQIAHDPRRFRLVRQTSFGRRHLKFWSKHPILLWPACFFRQFRRSISKADYFTLRNGFIVANIAEGGDFNFQSFLQRAFDNEFEKVVEIRLWIWMFSILFIFFSAHEFYSYYWLPIIPLVIALVVGAKLQMIITKMFLKSSNSNSIARGTFLVKPSDNLFWFGRPEWLLHLIQFIMIQNSFQLAFFAWSWYEFGLRSCFNHRTDQLIIRISTGVVVQLLCGYVTLPLYALVSQMGSRMKESVFTDQVVQGLKNWHKTARGRLSSKSTLTRNSSNPSSPDISISEKYLMKYHELSPESRMSSPGPAEIVKEKQVQEQDNRTTSSQSTSTTTALEITEEDNPKISTGRTPYDGEISFKSSWREVEHSKEKEKVSSISEEDSTDTFTGFNDEAYM